MCTRQPTNEVFPDWTLPVIFKVVQPICCLDQRRSAAGRRIGETNTIWGAAIFDLLFEFRRIGSGLVVRLAIAAGYAVCTNQSVAASRNGNDKALPSRPFIKYLPQRRDVDVDVALFHGQAGPHPLQQAVLGDDFALR